MRGRLEVQRPSPTTVSFTVSNAPQQSSSPAKIIFGLQVLLRTVLFFCVIGVGIARVRNLFFQEDGRVISWPALWSSPLGSKLCRLVDSYNPLGIAVAGALVIYGVFRRGHIGRLRRKSWLYCCSWLIVRQRNRSWLFEASESRPRHRPRRIFLLPQRGSFLRRKSRIL